MPRSPPDCTYVYLEAEVRRLAEAAWRGADVATRRAIGGDAYRHKESFRHGCVAGLGQAMRRARQEAVQETAGGSALVVAKEAELARAFRRFLPHTGHQRSRASIDGGAFERGRAAGERVNLDRQLRAG